MLGVLLLCFGLECMVNSALIHFLRKCTTNVLLVRSVMVLLYVQANVLEEQHFSNCKTGPSSRD